MAGHPADFYLPFHTQKSPQGETGPPPAGGAPGRRRVPHTERPWRRKAGARFSELLLSTNHPPPSLCRRDAFGVFPSSSRPGRAACAVRSAGNGKDPPDAFLTSTRRGVTAAVMSRGDKDASASWSSDGPHVVDALGHGPEYYFEAQD